MHFTDMTRPFWVEPEHPELNDITVLICQNQTPDLIRLCLESLLTFYPTIKILVINSTAKDESTWYLKFMESIHRNISIWDRPGDNSHGGALHDGFTRLIKTKYILTLDSDVIIKRGGWIEEMLSQINYSMEPTGYYIDKIFAIGTMNESSRSNDGISSPKDESDNMLYMHPSCAIYDREIYLKLSKEGKSVPDANKNRVRPMFVNHGAPCWSIMKAVEIEGYQMIGFPVENYVMHLTGASWTNPRTIWEWDNDVHIRSLVTFITDQNLKINLEGDDYDVIHLKGEKSGKFQVHGREAKFVQSRLFPLRFKVTGYFVCVLSHEISWDSLILFKQLLLNEPGKDEYHLGDLKFYTRKMFQSIISLA